MSSLSDDKYYFLSVSTSFSLVSVDIVYIVLYVITV